MQSKLDIRREIRATRVLADEPTWQAAGIAIRSNLLALPAVREAKSWFVYVSTAQEVDTHKLIRLLLSRGNLVAVPRIVGVGEMIAQSIRSFDELRLSEFGILAPPPGEPYQGAIDVCVCPGLAFSESGHRLGLGRGYYDRFLAATPPRIAIGLSLESFVKPELPVELHDRPMEFIVTEKRVIQCR